MKFVNIIILILAFSAIANSRNVSRRRELSKNKWFNLIMGALGELSEGNLDSIQTCIPADWKSDVEPAADTTTESGMISGDAVTAVQSVMKVLDPYITQICMFKDVIKDLLLKKVYKYNRHLFLEKPKKKAAPKKKTAPKKKAAAKAPAAPSFLDKMKSAATTIIKKVISLISKHWQTFIMVLKTFFNSPLVTQIENIFKCIEGMADKVKQLATYAKAIIDKVKKVISGQAKVIADVLIDLVCNFSEFKAAVDFLVQAKNEKDTTNKWLLTGKFIGKLFLGLAKTRRFRRFNRMLRYQ